jgi:hypothetical protein
MPPKRRDREGETEATRRRPGAEEEEAAMVDGIEGLVFEDPFGDEFEEEEYVDDGEEDEANEVYFACLSYPSSDFYSHARSGWGGHGSG